jgi:DNA repair protein RadC
MKNIEQLKVLSIKQWAEEDRPREKMLLKGISSLSDAELLAILINSGTANETAVEVAKKLLDKVNTNLNELAQLTIHELTQIKGIGEAKAIKIMTALELGRRRKDEISTQKAKITSSKDAFQVLYPKLADLPHEEFWILLLNRQNKVIEKKLISRGGISGTVADIRLIFKPAIEKLVSGIIAGHNHPSGNLNPSNADIALTKKLNEAGKILDIKILDHLIIADDNYFSFADEGLL